MKIIDPITRIDDYAQGLGVDRQYLLDRLDLIKKQPCFETMVIKENATSEDIAWVEAHSLEFPGCTSSCDPRGIIRTVRRWRTFWVMSGKSARNNWKNLDTRTSSG